MITVGIDVQSTSGKKTGLGHYTAGFVQELENLKNGSLRVQYYQRKKTDDLNTLQRLRWENFELYNLASRDKVKILHVPAFSPPIRKKWKLVVTVHDLIGLAFPNQLGTASRLYWSRWLPWSLNLADFVIADSEHTKMDILKYTRITENRIRVIYPSGHEGFSQTPDFKLFKDLQSRLGIREKYFLFVGTIEPRKNLARLMSAFVQFIRLKPSDYYQLVIVGSKEFAHGQSYWHLKALVDENPDRFVFTGYLDHESLNELYKHTEAFVFPSLYEGFGIPILEAMASGAPVITSNQTSTPEVAGDAALLINPESTGDITDALNSISKNPNLRRDLIEKGKLQITKFSWRKCASKILDVYKEVSG